MKALFSTRERMAIAIRYLSAELPPVTMAEIAAEHNTTKTTISNAVKYGSFKVYLQYLSRTKAGESSESVLQSLGISWSTLTAIEMYYRRRFHR